MTLIDRLSKLEWPDREVDAEICIALQYVAQKGATNIRRDPYDEEFKDEWLDFEIDGELWTENTPALTASVDAAIALAERVEPLLTWGRDSYQQMYLMGCGERYQSDHHIPAIALCIAILRAKEARNG